MRLDHKDEQEKKNTYTISYYSSHIQKIYEELGQAFSGKEDKVVIAKVDADAHRELGSRFGIKGFPTLKWFPKGVDGEPEDYSGGRDLDALASFVTKKSGVKSSIVKVVPAVTVLTDETFSTEVLNSGKSALVEFYAPWCGHCKNLGMSVNQQDSWWDKGSWDLTDGYTNTEATTVNNL
jgi:protein disulfide-isomerase A6